MFTSATAQKHGRSADERRSCHRTALQWAVLVFFGDNWGKLIDLSERGMSFQFAHTPSLGEPIHFTFEAMGCMPLPHDAKIFGESIQATGQVVWTLDFERTAGVKFLELSSRSRDQIRYWLSSPTGQGAVTPHEALNVGHSSSLTEELKREWANEWNQEAVQKAPTPSTVAGPAAPFVKTPPESAALESDLENLDSESAVLWEPETTFPVQEGGSLESNPELPRKPKSAFASLGHKALTSVSQPHIEREPEPERAFAPRRDPQASEMQGQWQTELEPEAQGLESSGYDSAGFLEHLEHEDRQRRGQTLELKQRRTRLGLTAVLAGLATVGALAGIIGFVSKFIGGAEVAGSAPTPLASKVDSIPTDGTDARVAAENATPFLVEVLDANNRRSVLWFSDDAHDSASGHVVSKSSSPLVSTGSAKTAEGENAAARMREPAHDFSLIPPHAGGPVPNASSSASSTVIVAPTLGEAASSPDVPLAGAIPRSAMPTPVEPAVRQGGDVQPARLIRAKLPDYPQLARASHAGGDVTLDALVDESGIVKDVKVISGPLLLRAAAKAALLQWKYEPARLDGQPTPMHLTVTMKFKDNQVKP